jgi:hypothetical protein
MLGRGDDRVALQRLEIGLHDDVRALGRKQIVRSLADQAVTRVAGQLLVGPVEQQEAPAVGVLARALDMSDNDRERDMLDDGVEEDLGAP